MKEYEIHFNIVGHGTAIVEANSKEEAQEKAKKFDIMDGSEELIEWEYEHLIGITPNE